MQLLPLPISSAFHVLSNFSNRTKLEDKFNTNTMQWDKTDKMVYNSAVYVLYNTAIAVAGFAAVSIFADKWHNCWLPVTLFALKVFPDSAWIGITGYGTVVGAVGVVQAIKERNPTQLAAYAALTLFSYFGTTLRQDEIHPTIQEFLYI